MRSAWELLRYLETEPAARRFLTERYASAGLEHPERLAYQQSHRFLYTCIQARTCYAAAAQCDLLIQPLLLFYGCVNLLKAFLLTRDPAYPQNSRVLQHGVTTRKIKKSAYQLLQDEVRPQKEGLFPHLARLLQLRDVQERYTLAHLFASLPELVADVPPTGVMGSWQPIQAVEKGERVLLLFPPHERGPLAFSPATLAAYLNRLAPTQVQFFPCEDIQSFPPSNLPPQKAAKDASTRCIEMHDAHGIGLRQHPLLYIRSASRSLFWNGSSDQLPLPCWAAHYLLLYALSMLCRYETEWWGELVLSRTMEEVYWVERFLTIHRQWFPRHLSDMLIGDERYFLQTPDASLP